MVFRFDVDNVVDIDINININVKVYEEIMKSTMTWI